MALTMIFGGFTLPWTFDLYHWGPNVGGWKLPLDPLACGINRTRFTEGR